MISPSLTPEQAAVVDSVGTSDNLLVNAVAGSGKTTTLVAAANAIPMSQPTLAVAFNKSISETFRARMPHHVTCSTFNSLGNRALSSLLRARVFRNKTNEVLKQALRLWPRDEQPSNSYQLLRLAYNYARQVGYVPADYFHDTAKLYPVTSEPIATEPLQTYLDIALRISLDQSLDSGTIDFDDQLYLPVILRLRSGTFSRLLVDECQDLNPIQLKLAELHGASGFGKSAKFIFCGDPRQAIYAFRGADADAFNSISESFSCNILPLTFTFRCAKSIVDVAREEVSYITAPETAPEGIVDEAETIAAADLSPTSAVICRYNAPLVRASLSMIADGYRPNYLGGRDLAREIGSILKDINDDPANLPNWLLDQQEKAEALRAPGIYSRAVDFAECIQALGPNPRARLDRVFSEDINNSLTLATIHKAKGQEYPRVALLEFDEIDRAHGQEGNCWYVGVTRAMQHLTFIREPSL